MRKKIILSIVLVIISMVILSANYVFASSLQSSKINTGDFKPPALQEEDYGIAFSKASTIVYTITIIGIVVSIVGTIGLGIRYMMGSIEERAEYKKTMWPMVLGMIFIFASSTIVSVIYNLASQLRLYYL